MWIFPWIKLFWHSGSMWDKLGWLNWFWQFLCDGLPSFNPKRFYYSYYSYLARDLFLENSTDSYLCFRLASLHSVSYFSFLYQSPSLSLCTAFNSISSNIDEVLSMNPSANEFVFEDYNVHHKDWLNYSVSIDLPINSKQDTPFHRLAYDYSRADWDGLRDHLRDVPWEHIFKLSASAASEFCEWVRVEIDAYIPHRKYQVKPHSSPWFSAACAAAIVQRNQFFCLYQKNKSSDSKVKIQTG